MTRITPEIPFPEAEGRISEYYDAPWPLSENYFLVAYSPKPLVWEPQANRPGRAGDLPARRRGNRELIYRDPAIGSSNPFPLVAPPGAADPAQHAAADAPPTGEMVLADVYQGLGDASRGAASSTADRADFPQDDARGRRAAVGLAGQERRGRSWAPCPSSPTARRGSWSRRASRSCSRPWTRTGSPIRRCGRSPTCSRARRSRASAATRTAATRRSQDDPGPAAAAVGDRSGPRRHAAVLLRPPGAADARPALRPLPRRREGGERHRPDGAAQDGFTRSYWALCGKSAYGAASQAPAESFVPRYGGWNPVHLTTPGGAYGARAAG